MNSMNIAGKYVFILCLVSAFGKADSIRSRKPKSGLKLACVTYQEINRLNNLGKKKMDKQIRKIEKEEKKVGKGLKKLEKADKKRDKVCEMGEKMMKKKKGMKK